MGITRKSTPRELEIRTENRCTLHPREKKRCTRCETVYDNIKENFDIHHKKDDGHYVYTGQCKLCLTKIREHRIAAYKTDITLYVKRLLPAIRCRAKEEGLEFDLTHDLLVQLWNQQQGKCYYTNKPMDLQATTDNSKSPHVNFPSVDKMVPSLGYVADNVVWCLWGINRMKNNLTTIEFVDFCNTVVEHFK